MARIRCPICQDEFETATSRAMPFCGERCRSVDLGRWLDERYGLPDESNDSESWEEVE